MHEGKGSGVQIIFPEKYQLLSSVLAHLTWPTWSQNLKPGLIKPVITNGAEAQL